MRWLFRKTCPAACRENHTYADRCLMVVSPRARAQRLEALLGASEMLRLLRERDRHRKP